MAPPRELEPNGPGDQRDRWSRGNDAIGSLPQVRVPYAAIWERKPAGYRQLPFGVHVAAETALGHPRRQPPSRVTGPQHAWPAAEATTCLFKIAEDEALVVWCECGASRMSFGSTLSRNAL